MTFSKAELRRAIAGIEAGMTDRELRREDGELVRRLLDLTEFKRAGTVMLFVGAGKEIDTRPVIEAALRAGKRVALPRITGPGTMEAREIKGLRELVPDKFGIPAPGEGCGLVPADKIDLILVPGVAFSPEGGRLGRGGGYYDRFLPRVRGVRAAMVRRYQMVGGLPRDEHDGRVDILITA